MFRVDQCHGQGDVSATIASTSKASRLEILRVARRRRRENKAAAAVRKSIESSTSSSHCLSDGDEDFMMAGMTIRKGSQPLKDEYNDVGDTFSDNASSVATPEEAAVSTMIMALENLSPMGHSITSGRSNSVPETPIRHNLSSHEDEDDYRIGVGINNIINNPVRRVYSTNDATGKRSQTRVRFQQSSKKAIVEEENCNTLSDSEANVVHKHHAAIKSAMKKRASGGAYTPEGQRRGRERQRAPFAPRAPKKGRRARRYAERDGNDSFSVQSDPTYDSSDSYGRPKKPEDFLDHLLDIISFDISVDEDTLGPYTDDDTFQSKEESLGRRARKKKGRTTYEFSNDTPSDADRGQGHDGDFQSACNSLDLPNTGKQVLSDISSALSFKEDPTSCNMDGPTEAGKQVFSGISSALSFGENKELRPSDGSKRPQAKRRQEKLTKAKQEETKPAFSYTCSMEDVFTGQTESPEAESPKVVDRAPPKKLPVERIDSAQLTFVSDLTSLAHHVPQVDLTATMIDVSRSFEESKRVLSGMKSPLGWSGPTTTSRVAPSPESFTVDNEELKLEIVYLEDAGKSDKDQEKVSMSAFGDELVQASTPGGEVKQQQPDSAEGAKGDFSDESISKIMAKGKDSMKKMSPNRNAKTKEKKFDPRSPINDFISSFQTIVSCNGSAPETRKETGKEEGQDFLTSLSQSFSFWSKETKETPTEAPADDLDKSTSTPVTRNTSIAGEGKPGEDLECSGEWEAMDRSFPKGGTPEEVKSSDDDASEASLKKEVTVTIHTLELPLNEDEKSSDSVQDKVGSRESAPGRDPEEVKDTWAMDETKSDDESFVNFDAPFPSPSPPRSPQYKMPKRSPGKTVKSLQTDRIQLSRKSQSWNPIRLKASTMSVTGSSLRHMFHRPKGPKDSPKKSPGESPIKAFSVTRTPPKVVRSEIDSPLLEQSEAPPEESQGLMEDQIIDDAEENDLIHSPTWPSADLNTTADSWQSFENEVFADSKSKKPNAPATQEEEEAEGFKITYQNQSAKWLKLYRASSKTQVDSPDTVTTVYGESNAEFTSFGRRSLLKALSGTTQGEF